MALFAACLMNEYLKAGFPVKVNCCALTAVVTSGGENSPNH